MKHLFLALTLGLATAATAQTLNVIPASSKLVWTGKKVTGQHTGGIGVKDGQLTWGADGLTAATITIDMRSITNTDLQGEMNAKLVGHLNSPDFFNTAEHATATFVSTSVEKIADAPAGKPNYRVTGDLTIKGITHPVTFDVLAWKEGKGARAAANLTFDRSKYDVRYASSSFFEGLGDKVIYDDVVLTFDVTAS
ncbi:MAG TPA: YceI family protein [Flavobacteriales bacterium]|jgi:polyisoprenoid-binding protein YceI|nr:YceI family protein [Flavobacteriales bacterium]